MHHFRSLLALTVLALAGTAFIQPATGGEKVRLEVALDNCTDFSNVLHIFEFNGINFRSIRQAPIQEGKAVFEMPANGPRFYYFGTDENNIKPLILGSEESVKVAGNCRQLRNSQFISSDLNNQYEELRQRVNALRQKSAQISSQYRAVSNNPEAASAVVAEMKKLDDEKLRLLDSLKEANPYFHLIAALNTYLSYQNHGEGFENELVYFARQYFQFVDWKDEGLNYMPWVYEAWKSFTETITNTGLQKEKHKELIDEALREIPADSRTYQLALGGIIAYLQTKNHPNFIPYAREFIQRFGAREPLATERLNAEVSRLEAFTEGGTAPDFSQPTPGGEELSLSDLRGQVVLVDFWASWCGPCRRENPNVVKMYNKYKDQGFTVLGVSLDKDRERWLKAIEDDGLTWNHISDLKGWQNSVAQLYGVRSIPHTVLVDQEGKIIARNLRGATLEARLAEIFGE